MRLACLLAALIQAAPAEKRVSATDLVSGAVSLFATRACGGSREVTEAPEWPAFIFDRKPPQGKGARWGLKKMLGCHGGTWVFTEAIAAGALWGQLGHEAIEADATKTLLDTAQTHDAFKTEFGWEPPAFLKLSADVLPSYEAKTLEALFDRLYVKPGDAVGSLQAQALYDHILKERVTRFVREAAIIKKKLPKAKLAKLTKEYQAAAKEKGESFDGPTYLAELSKAELAPPDEDSPLLNGRTLGTMLRRTADGTWPTVTKLLNKLVKAYDPALAKEGAL